MNKAGPRLDVFLARQYPQYSRSQIQKLIQEGYVSVDGEKRKPSFLLRGGEKVAMARRAPEVPKAEAEDIPLDILYEDADFLVINKPAGMVVHPAPGNFQGTLVNAILHHLKKTAGATLDTSYSEGQRPGIVHRLDKGTSGVMVIAKNEAAHKNLSNQFKNRRVRKTYQALVFGTYPQKKGTISLAIGRDHSHRRKFSSQTRRAREAVTHFEVARAFSGLSLLVLHPETGRTHQIRVHLSEKRHPIVGDVLYGAKSFLSSLRNTERIQLLEKIERPLLHAWKLEFDHPRTQKRISFEAPMPLDFSETLKKL